MACIKVIILMWHQIITPTLKQIPLPQLRTNFIYCCSNTGTCICDIPLTYIIIPTKYSIAYDMSFICQLDQNSQTSSWFVYKENVKWNKYRNFFIIIFNGIRSIYDNLKMSNVENFKTIRVFGQASICNLTGNCIVDLLVSFSTSHCITSCQYLHFNIIYIFCVLLRAHFTIRDWNFNPTIVQKNANIYMYK
jgi:hypothetical protein